MTVRDAPPPESSAPVANGRLAGLLSLGLLVGTVNGLSRVALPLYAVALHAQPWQVGLVGGFGYAGLLVLALPMGAWLDHVGSRVLFTRGVAAAALLYLAMPFVQLPWQAIVGTWLLGLLLPFRTIPAHTEFLSLVPRLSAAKAGWNRAANMTGMFFLGPALAAAVIAASGFAPVFVLAAIGLLAAGLLARRALEARPQAHTRLEPASFAQRIAAQLALLRDRAEVRRVMAIDFLTQIAVAYFVVFAVILAIRRFGLTVQAAAGLVTVLGALYVLTLFAAGTWLARWDEERRYLLAFVLLLAQALLFGLGSRVEALWLAAGLMGVGSGVQALISVNRFAALMQQHGRGRVGGLTSLGPPAGGVLGAMAGGLVSQQWGTEAGFRMLAVAYGVLVALQLRRLRRPPRSGGLADRS